MELERPTVYKRAKVTRKGTLRESGQFVSAFLLLFLLTATHPVSALAGQATLGWDANTAPGVAGYKVYYSNTSGTYGQSIDVGNTTSYTFSNLSEGHTYYFAAVAYDAAGNHSSYSNEVSKVIAADSQFTITAAAETGGSISPAGSVTVNSGSDQTFSISPAAGYVIADVNVDGKSVGAVASYTFKDLASNHTIYATFSAQATATLPLWNDATTDKTALLAGSSDYMVWSPVTADATAKVTNLRVSIGAFGKPTKIRLALYDQSGKKLSEGTGNASSAGYKTITVPSVNVVKGNVYYIAVQAASGMLKAFDCGATSGGYAARNTFSKGFPATLPSGWNDRLVTSGMYLQ